MMPQKSISYTLDMAAAPHFEHLAHMFSKSKAEFRLISLHLVAPIEIKEP